MASDAEAVAKHWYTEQRGRVVGNTNDWASLPATAKEAVVEEVTDLLEYMEHLWTWKKEP